VRGLSRWSCAGPLRWPEMEFDIKRTGIRDRNQMSITRKLYLFGFAIYVFSFFLPAIFVFNTPYYGYMSAYVAFGLLFDPIEIIDYYLIIAANIANICVLLVFILHFRVTFTRLLPLQLIAFLAAASLAAASLFQESELGPLLIGYWNWLFGIFFMLVVMVASFKANKTAQGVCQRDH
jgi:hypothetical protein